MEFTNAILIFTLPSLATACPYANLGDENPHTQKLSVVPEEEQGVPKKTKPARKLQTFDGTVSKAIGAAKEEVLELIDNRGRLGPLFVRMGFHDCVGGCDGCIDMSNPDNAGLDDPIEAIQEVVDTYARQLTRADVWALAALTAAEVMQDDGNPATYSFDYYGRVDGCTDPTTGDPVNMPANHLNTQELLDFFADEFQFTPQEAVVMMGAHTLGRVSNGNSGFLGTWTRQQTSLDNQFFSFLVDNGEQTQQYSLTTQGNRNGDALWVRNGGGGGNGGGNGGGEGGGNGGGQGGGRNGGRGGGGRNGGRGGGGRNGGGGGGRGRGGNLRNLQRGRGGGGRGGGNGGGGNGGGGGGGGGRLIMLNVDMALISDFTIVDDDGNTSCDVGVDCENASTFDQVAAYSGNNQLFLNDFELAFTAMTLNGYNDNLPSCDDSPCQL